MLRRVGKKSSCRGGVEVDWATMGWWRQVWWASDSPREKVVTQQSYHHQHDMQVAVRPESSSRI